MLNCAICDKDVQPVLDMGENGRVVSLCPACKSPLGNGLAATDQPQPREAPPPTLTVAGPKGGRMVGQLIAQPLDLVAAAKARLVVIDTELERLYGLQREQRRLRAMIQAADSADVEDNLALSVRRSLVAPPPTTEAAE